MVSLYSNWKTAEFPKESIPMPKPLRISLRACALACALALAAVPFAFAQRSEPAITLVKANSAEAAALPRAGAHPLAEDYRHFGSAKLGESSEPEVFTLDFHAKTKLTAISASNDFHVSGGTCIEGHIYSDGDVCSVEVVFTPQGPGHRTGALTMAHTASVRPMLVPMGGDAYGPTVSFIPAQIATVPTTFVSGAGLLARPQGLAIDGGDSLLIADTGNNLIRYQDSSGVLSVLAGGGANAATNYQGPGTGVRLSSPYGVAVDSLGDAWISDTGNDVVRVVGPAYQTLMFTPIGGGTGTPDCTPSNPCSPTFYPLPAPYGIAIDPSGDVFVNVSEPNGYGFGAEPVEDASALYNASFYYLDGVFDDDSDDYPIAVDADKNIYYTYELPAATGAAFVPLCNIVGQNHAISTYAGSGDQIWKVAGTNTCGFSGDGGLATGAEISSSVQGFAWDAAGNFYFTDTGNNRVRRIDEATGVIRTVAGNGVAGYAGDGGPATSAEVWAPTGVGVDSRGDVFVETVQEQVSLSKTAPEEARAESENTGGGLSFSVVRKIGPIGEVVFPAQLIGAPSAARTILVSNAGNSDLDFTSEIFTSGNTGDFSIDPNTTSCRFTAPLFSGESCLIGIIFRPAAAGARSAVLTLLDDTVTGSNVINLSGTGATAAAAQVLPNSLTFASQTDGTSSASQPVTLSNTGGLPLTINSYIFTGTNMGDFSQTHTCGATLAGGAHCTINVTFTPVAAGSPTATLSVNTSAGLVTVTLHGTSTAAVRAKVTLVSKVNPAAVKEPIPLNTNVAGTSSASKEPTGKVQLREGNTVLATATLSGGAVAFKVSNLSAGTHELTAYYLGDTLHEASESPAVKQVVSSGAKVSKID
jgi:sugar lactone lactonase YvrE